MYHYGYGTPPNGPQIHGYLVTPPESLPEPEGGSFGHYKRTLSANNFAAPIFSVQEILC